MERAKELEHMTVTAENRKHIEEELNEINKILIKYNGIKHHTPVLEGVKAELLLMTNRLHREVVRRQIPVKDTKLHPLGVLVKTDNIPLIMQVRTFRKMYFTIHAASLLPKDAQEAAGLLAESDACTVRVVRFTIVLRVRQMRRTRAGLRKLSICILRAG